MSQYTQKLLDKRNSAWEQAKAIIDAAEADGNRSLTAEENESYTRISDDMRSLDEQRARFEEDEKAAADLQASLRSHSEKPQERNDPSEDAIDKELREFFAGETKRLEFTPTDRRELSQITEARALSVGTATAGGNTVPRSFYGTLWEHLIETATLPGQGCTIFTTDSGENFDIPVTTSHGAAEGPTAEAAQMSGTDPAFTKRTLSAYKFDQLILTSRELLEDSGVDIKGYVGRIAGRNIGNKFGQALISGAGGGTTATGIFTSATAGVTGGTGVAGVPTLDNLIDLLYSVIGPYRQNGKWLMKDTTAGKLRKIKDTTGQYIWQPAVIAGQPDLLLGKPVATDPYVASTGLNAASVLFGDLSSYAARVVNKIRFEQSTEFKFDTDQIAFKAVLRGDGLLIDQTGAVKTFVGGAS